VRKNEKLEEGREENRYHENNKQEGNNEKKKGVGYFQHRGRRREDGKDKSAVHGG